MTRHRSEMFAHFLYDQALTYTELLDREAELMASMQHVFDKTGAAHVEFTPTGDALGVRCSFRAQDESLFHSVCDAVTPLLRHDVQGRLLFVDTSLDIIHLYLLAEGTWKEGALQLPGARDGLSRIWL